MKPIHDITVYRFDDRTALNIYNSSTGAYEKTIYLSLNQSFILSVALRTLVDDIDEQEFSHSTFFRVKITG